MRFVFQMYIVLVTIGINIIIAINITLTECRSEKRHKDDFIINMNKIAIFNQDRTCDCSNLMSKTDRNASSTIPTVQQHIA